MDCELTISLSILEIPEVEETITDEVQDDTDDDDEDQVVGEGDEIFLLEEWPWEPEPILCSGTSSSKNWEYQFPDVVEKDCQISFFNPILDKLL